MSNSRYGKFRPLAEAEPGDLVLYPVDSWHVLSSVYTNVSKVSRAVRAKFHDPRLPRDRVHNDRAVILRPGGKGMKRMSKAKKDTAEKPIWHTDGVITLPSPRTSISDMIAMIPVSNRDDVEVYLGQDCIAIIRRP